MLRGGIKIYFFISIYEEEREKRDEILENRIIWENMQVEAQKDKRYIEIWLIYKDRQNFILYLKY